MALDVEQLKRIRNILTEEERGIKSIDKALSDPKSDIDRKDMLLAKSMLVKSYSENSDLIRAVDETIFEIESDWKTQVMNMLPDNVSVDDGPSTLFVYDECSGLSLSIIEHGESDFGLVAEINDVEVANDLLSHHDSISSTLSTVLRHVEKFFGKVR